MSKEIKIKIMDNYINNLIEVTESITCNKITILTGRNAGGKSLIRKLLPSKMKGINIISTSMEQRSNCSGNLFDSRVVDADCEWLATSHNSISNVIDILKSSDKFIIIDEPEIGVGEELQMGLGLYLKDTLIDVISKNKGVLIITHSKHIVNTIKDNTNINFINLEGLSIEEWLNRDIKPITIDEYFKWSNELRVAIGKRKK